MPKVISRAGQGKALPPRPAGKAAPTPPHDHIPFARGGETVPKDKGWCRKCKAWRFYRNLRRIILGNGTKAFQGSCVKCGTKHTFVPQK
jgi:hypothetical protein